MNHSINVPVREVAQRHSVSVSTIWRWVNKGQFPKPIKLSPGCTRWRISDIQEWEASKEVQS